jgi:hypothetical protein
MTPDWRTLRNPLYNARFVHGLKVALLLSIPVWMVAGLTSILTLQNSPITALECVALMCLAAAELLLLRHFLNSRDAPARRAVPVQGSILATIGMPWSAMVKRSLALSGMSVAFLQYYYLDVQLQIASLHSVTVFVPVNALG